MTLDTKSLEIMCSATSALNPLSFKFYQRKSRLCFNAFELIFNTCRSYYCDNISNERLIAEAKRYCAFNYRNLVPIFWLIRDINYRFEGFIVISNWNTTNYVRLKLHAAAVKCVFRDASVAPSIETTIGRPLFNHETNTCAYIYIYIYIKRITREGRMSGSIWIFI